MCILSMDMVHKNVYNNLNIKQHNPTQTQATEQTTLINLYRVPVSEQSSNTNRHASDTEVATKSNKEERTKSMCISKQELDKKVATIREYKSIKKDAETNLKPLEQEVKEYMEETNQTKYIGYGYSISYKEQTREDVVKKRFWSF